MKIKLTFLLYTLCFASLLNAQGGWMQRAAFPGAPRNQAVCFVIGNKAYVGPDGVNNDFWEWDQGTNIWTRRADFPDNTSQRSWLAGFSIGTKGYIGTGIALNGTLLADFYEWDQQTDTWTRKADVNPGRGYGVGFSIGNKGYISTGIGALSDTPNTMEYDPQNDTWTTMSLFPGGVRTSAIAAVMGGKAYIGTGTDSLNHEDFWEWNPIGDVWVQKANCGGGPRSSAISFVLGNKYYAGVGFDLANKNDLWEYDVNSNSWTQMASFPPGARSGAVAFSIGTRGYVALGDGNLDLWEFDPTGLFGIEDVSNNASFHVFPNPASGEFTLNLHAVQKSDLVLKIMNALGETVYSETQKDLAGEFTKRFDLGQYPKGLYMIEAVTGDTRKTRKLVMQ